MGRFETTRHARRRLHLVTASVIGLTALLAAGRPLAAADYESRAFAASLRGEPQVGCIVTAGGARCSSGEVRGALLADGEPAFGGTFVFALPGLRSGQAPIGRRGRGKVVGTLAGDGGAEPVRCVFKGRLRAQGVAVPAGAATRRFHAGRFDARGRCGGEPALMNAIWSGSIGNTDGAFVASFERFEGRLAGTIRMRGGSEEVTFRLPSAR